MSKQIKNLSEVIANQPSHSKDIDIDSDDLEIQRKLKLLQAKRYSSDTLDRKWLAIWTAFVVSIWLGAVLYILINNTKEIHLSDAVIATLLATTTLNVLGLSFIVLRGHFNSSKIVSS